MMINIIYNVAARGERVLTPTDPICIRDESFGAIKSASRVFMEKNEAN